MCLPVSKTSRQAEFLDNLIILLQVNQPEPRAWWPDDYLAVKTGINIIVKEFSIIIRYGHAINESSQI